MDKDDIKEYLRGNLSLYIGYDYEWHGKALRIKLLLEDEEIDSDSIIVEKYEE